MTPLNSMNNRWQLHSIHNAPLKHRTRWMKKPATQQATPTKKPAQR